jgi:hypothetical protein
MIKPTQVPGAKVFYTLDGSEPTKDSTTYTSPFMIDSNGENTVKAMSIKVAPKP